MSVRTAKGVLVNITGGADLTLFEVKPIATFRLIDGNARLFAC
jgi:cell division GTPase FtsZ